MTTVAPEHVHEHAARPAPTGWRRLLAPGWLRVPWMIALFFGIGAGITVLVRWFEGWHPIWKGSIITTVELTSVPIGFLAGIGAFDYWARYFSGAPTVPEDHSGHGARSWRDYFRVNTDHKVIGVQYLVTTIFFFLAGGLLAMFVRAELAKPGAQYFDPQTYNGLFSVHASLMIFLFVIPAFAGLANFVVPLMLGAPDMAFPRMPLLVWATFTTSLLVVIATPFIAGSQFFTMFDRVLHTHFFDPTAGGYPLGYQHIFWFYSHPAVYIMMLPGFGIASEVISVMARKPIFGYRLMALSLMAILILGFSVWAHHMFVAGVAPWLRIPMMVTSMVIAV